MFPMMIPDPREMEDPICLLVDYWKISHNLAQKLVVLGTQLPFSFYIISGFRSRQQQDELERAGRPTAPYNRSTHTTCLATGADVRLTINNPTDNDKLLLKVQAEQLGLRVGGGGPVDPRTGIPVDWNHIDEGPRLV